MSNQGRAPAAQANPNILRVNPAAFEQDYEFGRAVAYGVVMPVYILEAAIHTSRKGLKSIRVTLGAMSSQPHPTTGKPCGAKVETYEPLAGERYRNLIAAVAPEALTGGDVDVSKWAGRKARARFIEEVDRLQSEKTGFTTMRARMDAILPPAAATAAQSGASLL